MTRGNDLAILNEKGKQKKITNTSKTKTISVNTIINILTCSVA